MCLQGGLGIGIRCVRNFFDAVTVVFEYFVELIQFFRLIFDSVAVLFDVAAQLGFIGKSGNVGQAEYGSGNHHSQGAQDICSSHFGFRQLSNWEIDHRNRKRWPLASSLPTAFVTRPIRIF